MTNLRGKKTTLFQYVVAAILVLPPVLPDLPPISGNPHDVGDYVEIYLQNEDPERKTR